MFKSINESRANIKIFSCVVDLDNSKKHSLKERNFFFSFEQGSVPLWRPVITCSA